MKDMFIKASTIEGKLARDAIVLGAAVRAVALGGSRLSESELAGVLGSRYLFQKYGTRMRKLMLEIEAAQEATPCDSLE